MDVKTIRREEFDLLKDEWNDLLARSAGDNVFLRWEWIRAWWDVFKKHRELFIVTAREGGRLVGVAPFYVDRSSILGPRRLRLCSDGLYPDGLDAFAERGLEREVLGGIRALLLARAREWDVMVLEHLRVGALLLRRDEFFGDYEHAVAVSAHCAYIKMEGDFSGYLAAHPSLKKFSLKKKMKRLLETEGVSHKMVADEASLPKALQDLFLVHDKRAQDKKITTAFTSPEVKQFHGLLGGLFLKEDILRLQLLYVGDTPISAVYCFKYKNKIYFYQSGMDPEWKRLSAGMVLMSLAIEGAFSEGLEEFDFLKGDEGYKGLWSDDVRLESRFVVYNKTWRGSLARGATGFRGILRRVKHAFDGPPREPVEAGAASVSGSR